MSMPTLTLTPVSSTFPSSNSSYFEGAEETYVLQLRGKIPTTDAVYTSTPRNPVLLRKNVAQDGELDVFNAEKYFKDALNSTPSKYFPSRQLGNKDEPLKALMPKERSQNATPSIWSDSSQNSRSKLLHGIRRTKQPLKPKKQSFLGRIGCSCGDKSSVDIDEHYEETRSRNSSRNGKLCAADKTRDDHLVSKSHSGERFVKFNEPILGVNPIKQTTIQVFGSPHMENENNLLSMKNKLTMLSWDATVPRVADAAPTVISEAHDDDFSDASSDLFEIESLSKGDLYRPTTCYAPSEASIDWSVVTASAADLSEDFKSNNGSSKDLPKRLPNFLSGCKSQKAVGVALDAHRAKNIEFNNLKRNVRSESFSPISRFPEGLKA